MHPLGHEPFLRAISEAPDDDAPRLVFADWLDENSEPERAEFIRLQVRLARAPQEIAIEQRCEELLRANWPKWVITLHGTAALWTEFTVSNRPTPGATRFEVGNEDGLFDTWIYCQSELKDWERGFPASVYVQGSSDLFLNYVNTIHEFVPVRRLRLMNLDDPDSLICTLAGVPLLQRVRDLMLRGVSIADDAAVALANSPFASGLRLVSMIADHMSDRAGRAFAESPYLGGLESLHLLRNHFAGSVRSQLRSRFGFRVQC